MIISAVYITGFAMDNKISCSPNPLQQDPKHSSFSVTPTMLVEQGTRKQSCTVLFMILYFSTMSSAIWWLVLCYGDLYKHLYCVTLRAPRSIYDYLYIE